MTLKVRMYPHPDELGAGESGIHTVIRNYAQYLPPLGVELVTDPAHADLAAVHAGMASNLPAQIPMISLLHGLYWTADYHAPHWEYKANQAVIDSIHRAQEVTVPSPWVAETLQRDMRFSPHVVPHGVDWAAMQHTYAHEGYVLGYAKNRADSDVCDPNFLTKLAAAHPGLNFVATFGPRMTQPNIYTTGVVPYAQMREITQKAAVFISPIKETFGLHALEALAAGTPVLSTKHGGVTQFVQHGVNGYLYDPRDPDDMAAGLAYCLQYRDGLSANARELSRQWTWQAAAEKLVEVFRLTATPLPPRVGYVIPYYNKTREQLTRAIDSLMTQTHPLERIVVVDDGSKDNTAEQVTQAYPAQKVVYVRQENQGVAQARNNGAWWIQNTWAETKYIGFLDADDWLRPTFVETCVKALEADPSLHLAYTKLHWTEPDGRNGVSEWPGPWDFTRQITPRGQTNLRGHNQVPTANLMRLRTFTRLGGYRSRYEGRTAAGRAGAEDAELWTRWGAYGYKAALVSEEPLFEYTASTGVTSQEGWQETAWLEMHPWALDGAHPFASYAKPGNMSHPVRQYDEPTISVVVPVGPGHVKHLQNALDSLESQTFRKWEVLVVDDSGTGEDDDAMRALLAAYPYIRLVVTSGHKGAGYARNRGVEQARGDFLVFLDADDTLEPDALAHMLRAWRLNPEGVYTDYVGLISLDNPEPLRQQIAEDPYRDILSWDGQTLAIRHTSAKRWDWEKAQRQPVVGEPPYVPCLVTTLLPRAWHVEIGGFDENMASWEDVDYYWRLARAGKCMQRLPEPLVVYRFQTGTRREAGLHQHKSLLEYLLNKYSKEKPPLACNCGANKSTPTLPTVNSSTPSMQVRTVNRQTVNVADNDMVLAMFASQNKSISRVIGNVSKIDYGYRAGGEQFFVHKNDLYMPNGRVINPPQFIAIAPEPIAPPVPVAPPPPPPVLHLTSAPVAPVSTPVTQADAPQKEDTGMQLVEVVSGIGPATAKKLAESGIRTINELILAGEDVLRKAGLSESKAQAAYTNAMLLLS